MFIPIYEILHESMMECSSLIILALNLLPIVHACYFVERSKKVRCILRTEMIYMRENNSVPNQQRGKHKSLFTISIKINFIFYFLVRSIGMSSLRVYLIRISTI
ncbi:hypothetical protein AAZV13_19G100700 [Glycine max]